MEENKLTTTESGRIDLLSAVLTAYSVKPADIRSYSPLTLAYIGDCVYEIIVRSVVVGKANRQVDKLHRLVSGVVKAETQCKLFDVWVEELPETEVDILKRGRNARPHTTAKNASAANYHKATGVEALIGYLYLTGNTDRAITLLKDGLERCGIRLETL